MSSLSEICFQLLGVFYYYYYSEGYMIIGDVVTSLISWLYNFMYT